MDDGTGPSIAPTQSQGPKPQPTTPIPQPLQIIPGTDASAVHHLIHPLVHLPSTTCSNYWHVTDSAIDLMATNGYGTSGGQPKLMSVTAQAAKK
ncbi:hypothetical protein J1N35_022805 [Gossypium stocksii]|uniref:Uncharacterized protein n=1 Tax=Gossypium stocksii TaxID=47602 RepID=A0A9D3VJ68_9ROSI|nr:hypothetical protein J1N35_022805 [Gossypium stocksii]